MEKNTQNTHDNQSKSNQTRQRRPNPYRNPNRTDNQGARNQEKGGHKHTRSNNQQRPNHPNRNPKTQNRNPASRNGNKNGTKRKNVTTVSAEMQRAIDENNRIQAQRMAPWKKIATDTKGRIRFTPLGGLGEIGGNMAVLETETTAIVIDVGMSFPDETMHGVDILVPDFSYLHAIKNKIKAVVITHGHEDHIGAVPYLFKELKFPIYGTPLALAMIENKFKEHGLNSDTKYFNFVIKRRQYQIGDMKIEWIHNTHSIIDACSLAIETPIGTLFHTADFKVDHTPVDGLTMDLHRIAYYGEKGILCLFSDSTNSHNPGFTKSEKAVGKTFDQLFEMAKGRVIMSTFSSNVHRIFQAMQRGVKHNRKICIIGRSMERNVETNRALGYVDIDDRHFIDVHEVSKYPDHEVLIVTTGSQGETMAALNRMASDEHRHIKLKPSDTVIISASAIPGNEASVSKLMNLLMKAGVTVRYKEFSDIHVSGHAAQEEQKLILRLTQPKFFLPVHGEYNHIAAHAKTAVECGIPERNILLMSDGDQIEITPKYIKKVKTVKTGKKYIDNQNNATIENDIVLDRQKLAEEGIINIVAQISAQEHKLLGNPVVTTFGIIPDKEDKQFAKEVKTILENILLNMKKDLTPDHKYFENAIRETVRKHIIRTKKKYPLIIPTVFLV